MERAGPSLSLPLSLWMENRIAGCTPVVGTPHAEDGGATSKKKPRSTPTLDHLPPYRTEAQALISALFFVLSGVGFAVTH
jgi:hypothetical protein